MDGLRAYLSALNIRNKCKHPLFLVLRFDTCIGLLYDPTRERNPAEDDTAFVRMMSSLGAAATQQASGAPPAGNTGGRSAPFMVAVKSSHGEHACGRLDCPVKLSAGFSLPNASSLPDRGYVMLNQTQLAKLRRTYCRLYHGGHHPRSPLVPASRRDLCDTCSFGPESTAPLPAVTDGVSSHQRQAAAILGSVRQLGAGSCENPEEEWDHALRVLADAMAMHCSTRTTDEILSFMRDDPARFDSRIESSPIKRPLPAGHGPGGHYEPSPKKEVHAPAQDDAAGGCRMEVSGGSEAPAVCVAQCGGSAQ